jgi:hypothetical protein
MTRHSLLLCLLLPTVGCGTMANMKGCPYPGIGPSGSEPQLFGGVANDLRWVGEEVEKTASIDELPLAPVRVALAGYFGLVDLPLSLVGDTLTLPAVIGGMGKGGEEKPSPDAPTSVPHDSSR